MRLPPAIRSWPCAVVAAVLTCTGVARAQYMGGDGDGYSVEGRIHARLDALNTNSPAYHASLSGGDGYDASGRVNLALNGVSLPLAVFKSSAAGGDGYDTAGRSNQMLTAPAPTPFIFAGGGSGGDGYDTAGLTNHRLDPTVADFLASYSGGTGDGYDVLGHSDLPLNVNLAYGFVFSGGAGDGYDTRGIVHSSVAGSAADPSPYTSSLTGGDGYDTRGLVHTRLDGASPHTEVYASSNNGGDGYDVTGVVYQSITGTPHFVTAYLGDFGDGYDEAGVRNSYLNPALLPPIAVFRGDAGDGYHVASAPYVYYLGAGGAASPMTYSIWRFINFSPEDITAGLAADGADPDADGLPNLVEYTIGSDPRQPDSGAYGPQFSLSNLSDFGFAPLPEKHLTAVVHRNPRIFDAKLSIEVNDDLLSLWDTSDVLPVNSTPSLFIVRDRLGISEAPRRVMRLRARLTE